MTGSMLIMTMRLDKKYEDYLHLMSGNTTETRPNQRRLLWPYKDQSTGTVEYSNCIFPES